VVVYGWGYNSIALVEVMQGGGARIAVRLPKAGKRVHSASPNLLCFEAFCNDFLG